MRTEVFQPETDSQHKFAVAVPTESGMAVIHTYETREALEAGYREWQEYASKRGVISPYPIEFLDQSQNGRCRILEDLLEPHE